MTRRTPPIPTLLRILTLALIPLLGACGGQRLAIEYDYDYDANFESLKTWSWLARKGSETGNAEADKVIREELAAELVRRGFREVEAEADFRVGFLLETDRKMTERHVYTQFGYSYDYMPFDSLMSVNVVVDDYLQGTLIVDIAAPDGKQPLWRGWAEGVIREKSSDEQMRSAVRDAVRSVLAKFPPPATRKKSR